MDVGPGDTGECRQMSDTRQIISWSRPQGQIRDRSDLSLTTDHSKIRTKAGREAKQRDGL